MNKLQELKLANTLRSIERYLTLYFEGGRHSAGDHVCDQHQASMLGQCVSKISGSISCLYSKNLSYTYFQELAKHENTTLLYAKCQYCCLLKDSAFLCLKKVMNSNKECHFFILGRWCHLTRDTAYTRSLRNAYKSLFLSLECAFV